MGCNDVLQVGFLVLRLLQDGQERVTNAIDLTLHLVIRKPGLIYQIFRLQRLFVHGLRNILITWDISLA